MAKITLRADGRYCSSLQIGGGRQCVYGNTKAEATARLVTLEKQVSLAGTIPDDGRTFWILSILDEYTRECLALVIKRRLNAQDVLDKLFDLFLLRAIPEHIRSDNGPEFTAKAVRDWLARMGVTTLVIEPGSPWKNSYVESFQGKLRDELLNSELFTTPLEAKVLTENWRRDYNRLRPHGSLGYRPPTPEAIKLPVLAEMMS